MQKRKSRAQPLSTSAPESDSSHRQQQQRPTTVIDPQGEPQILATRARPKPKQPNRTTKATQKLRLFPEEGIIAEQPEGDTYNQITQLPQGTARQEAERFSKSEREKLPRVTAYCTASAYQLDGLMKEMLHRKILNKTAPTLYDECMYTPFSFEPPSSPPRTANIIFLDGGPDTDPSSLLSVTVPEVLMFEFGVVVIWGMTEEEEKTLLQLLVPYEEEKFAEKDVETEEFHFHYAVSYQPRIYNDVITLKNNSGHMVKLTISHAIAQSVKMTMFEELIEDTINATKDIPQRMAETGKVHMSRTAITKKIGQLFIMRMNVNLISNVLDTPEIFWSEPAYEELYQVVRGYLEISQRIELLNQRVAVISDLLDMLKEHLTSSHGEQLEWIVIVLIAVEIVIGVITILIDLEAS